MQNFKGDFIVSRPLTNIRHPKPRSYLVAFFLPSQKLGGKRVQWAFEITPPLLFFGNQSSETTQLWNIGMMLSTGRFVASSGLAACMNVWTSTLYFLWQSLPTTTTMHRASLEALLFPNQPKGLHVSTSTVHVHQWHRYSRIAIVRYSSLGPCLPCRHVIHTFATSHNQLLEAQFWRALSGRFDTHTTDILGKALFPRVTERPPIYCFLNN